MAALWYQWSKTLGTWVSENVQEQVVWEVIICRSWEVFHFAGGNNQNMGVSAHRTPLAYFLVTVHQWLGLVPYEFRGTQTHFSPTFFLSVSHFL